MLKQTGYLSLDELIDATIPSQIRLKKQPDLPKLVDEADYLRLIKQLAQKNKVFTSFIGQGYYGTITPTVIQRNILENPGWYTAYTPYQAEIAQGRLEALLNFQTMVCDLTGMPIANASLLDEGTAAAEAMAMLYHSRPIEKKNSHVFLVDINTFPQTIEVLKTRAKPLGIDIHLAEVNKYKNDDEDTFGMFVQYPNSIGGVADYTQIITEAHSNKVQVCLAADLLALTLLKSPGEMGADVAVGSTQRLGVPMGYGGPHAAYLATNENYKRLLPGRIIGVSVDVHGNKAYRMALQTREQHIRREKATSNICTAQVLLAVMASMYAVYHGPNGLKDIALRVHGLAKRFYNHIKALGYEVLPDHFFDTVHIKLDEQEAEEIKKLAEKQQMNLFYGERYAQVSWDETHNEEHLTILLRCFAAAKGKNFNRLEIFENGHITGINEHLLRSTSYLTHPVFNSYHTEHELLRYMKKLENKDLSMVHGMIPLGSCTMKLNATTEMIPVTWPEWNAIHPFAPNEQVAGYTQLVQDLEKWLAEITGFYAVSLQPNSGAQGEYAGLLTIRNYHESKSEQHRNVALIPSSAHGTNPASAVMAGMRVVVVACDEKGNIDVADLQAKAESHSHNLACLMITYPSTHGVFEEDIVQICEVVHNNGGLVYMDGANMNAQVCLTNPAQIGADVCHLNLHKTFCIPHGGGGPGMGPIGVTKALAPHLPGHIYSDNKKGAVSSAPYGSASILPISYAYIQMMGYEGLKMATSYAILNANYMKCRLQKYYPILYTGKNGTCAHEFIIDGREFKKIGIEVEDIAKRLMDYGFHAPTVSFPVPGTLMIEPTESESKAELDRFCDALIQIRHEIEEVAQGIFPKDNNVLKNAPHTASVVCADVWEYPYSRQKAAYPLAYVKDSKFWPSVSRIDSAYGDRNLICACVPVEEYA